MDDQSLKNILEALLMSAGQPLTLDQLLSVFNEWDNPGAQRVKVLLAELSNDYTDRAFSLVELANGYCLQTKAEYGLWISRMQAEKPAKYSRALLETLAIIAYKQPVTRADIEDVRGVAVSSSILKTLIEREWIKIAGHRDVPGKPAVYVTTKRFLDYFNLSSIEQLPAIANQAEMAPLIGEALLEECVEE